MCGNYGTYFPVADDRIERRVHVFTKLFASAHRQLIVSIAGQHVFLVEEAWSPIRTRVINVLRSRLSAGTGRAGAAPTGPEVSRRIAQALRIGIGNLPLEAVGHALLKHRLEGIIALAGVGHVRAK